MLHLEGSVKSEQTRISEVLNFIKRCSCLGLRAILAHACPVSWHGAKSGLEVAQASFVRRSHTSQSNQGPSSDTAMKSETQRIKRLSNQAELLKQQLAAVEKEYVHLYMREKALQRMVTQSTVRYTALADIADHPAACSSNELFEAHVPSSSMRQCPPTDASARAQDLTVCELVTEHIAYVGRASVLLVRMGTYAAMPGDLAELEELTRCHWGNIVKTAMTSIQTVWLCYGLNFETVEVEEAPDELFPDVFGKLGLTQEQMLTLSAGTRASLCCM